MRPTKYNEEIQKQADDYVNNDILFEKYEEQYVDKLGRVKTVEKQRPTRLPSKSHLAYKLKVHRETLDNWAKQNRQFFDTLERLRQLQEMFLTYHGLNRSWDSTQTKMHQSNMLGWSDKVEQKVEQKNIEIKIDSDDIEL